MSKSRNIADLGSNDVIETSATGVDVTGTITADGLSVGDASANNYSGLSALSNIGVENADVYGFSTTEGGFTVNAKYESGWKHTQTGTTSRYSQIDGTHRFYSADSDTAGSAITWENCLKIDTNGDVSFYEDTGTTAKMVWDASAESLGIGTASPSAPLEVNGGTQNIIQKLKSTDDGCYLQFNDDNALGYYMGARGGNFAILNTDHSTKFHIDSAGNVGIGTASPDASVKLHVQGAIGTTNGTASAPTHTFYGDSNTGMFRAAVDTLGWSTNGSERARIDSSGNLLVNCTTPPSASVGGAGFIKSVNGADLHLSTTVTTGDALALLYNPNGLIGSITASGSAVSFNETSDERVKENIQDTAHAVDINDIQIRQFDWKADGSHQRYGVIAQELNEVYPEAVYSPEDKDALMGVDYSKLVPLLVKEMQQLKARIETLENN